MEQKNIGFPVEYLIFQVEDSQTVDEFIKKDAKIWTSFLQKNPAFKSKEIWINDQTPGEIHSIITWENLEGWKSISEELCKDIDKEFKSVYGKPFYIKRRVHSEYDHQFLKVDEYVKSKEEKVE